MNQTDSSAENPLGSELDALSRLVYEVGHLKLSPRTGWFLAGIGQPESVAEHSLRTAAIGALLALLEGADAGRTALMCIFHDLAETRTSDIPSVGKHYLVKTPDSEVVLDQIRGTPTSVEAAISSLVQEFNEGSTTEARLARDADKIECLAQAKEYQSRGVATVQDWVVNSLAAVKTEKGTALAKHVAASDPGLWWQDFVRRHND